MSECLQPEHRLRDLLQLPGPDDGVKPSAGSTKASPSLSVLESKHLRVRGAQHRNNELQSAATFVANRLRKRATFAE